MMFGFRGRGLRRSLAGAALSITMVLALIAAPQAGALRPGEFRYAPSRGEIGSVCPVANPEVLQCLHAAVYGGSVTLGKLTVPITVPGNTLDFGNSYNYATSLFQPIMSRILPLNGPAQPVPGGLFGLTGMPSTTAVTSNLEYAGALTPLQPFGTPETVSFSFDLLSTGEAPAIVLPVKIHLHNPFFGNNCYIGSNTEPIIMRLTTGATHPPLPNKSIVGYAGYLEFMFGANVTASTAAKLVDNSLSVPGANGCGAMLNKAIDLKVGLPSAAGHNSMVFLSNAWISGAGYARGE
jgi:hypothetical protein